MRISIHIATKDRHSEVSLLLQSLREQSYQDWDIVMCDESQTPIDSCEFLVMLINKIREEGHHVNVFRNDLSRGVCHVRNLLLENDYFKNPLILRLDDDVVLEADYIQKLVDVIHLGYDIASGVTPSFRHPLVKRENTFVKPIINAIETDDVGNITKFGDDCGIGYIEDDIIPTHHFRSCALFKSKVFDKIKYPTNLTPVGFREESFISIEALLAGYKLAVHTGAIAWHFQTMSGGCRYPDYTEKVQTDDKTFQEWFKKKFQKHGDFLKKYDEKCK